MVQVTERIRINGQPIGKELFTKYFWQIYRQLEETKVGVKREKQKTKMPLDTAPSTGPDVTHPMVIWFW